MENLHELELYGSGIEALPSSIKYLTALESLDLEYCKRLEFVPHTIAQMQSLNCLKFTGCPLIVNALSRWDESSEKDCSTSSSSSSFSLKSSDLNICHNISELYLDDCNLQDEHLALIPKFFPLLQVLSLRRNQFEAIPECFQAFQRLELLRLDRCRKLQEFPNILSDMPKLVKISTRNCMALRPQSVDSLLEIMVKRFWMPVSVPWLCRDYILVRRRRVPEWLDQCSEGKTISFYARGNYLPRFILCFSFDSSSGDCNYSLVANLVLSINENEKPFRFSTIINEEGRNYLWIIDPHKCDQCDFEAHVRQEWDCARWNHVEVLMFAIKVRSISMVIMECGIYFNKEETRMEDIRF